MQSKISIRPSFSVTVTATADDWGIAKDFLDRESVAHLLNGAASNCGDRPKVASRGAMISIFSMMADGAAAKGKTLGDRDVIIGNIDAVLEYVYGQVGGLNWNEA
jgi:hypothetical protein